MQWRTALTRALAIEADLEALMGDELTDTDRRKAVRHTKQALVRAIDTCLREAAGLVAPSDEDVFKNIVADARGVENDCKKDRGAVRRKLWQEKLSCKGKVATKRAFMSTQLPPTWKPPEALDPTCDPTDKVMTGEPAKILQAERDRLGALWRSSDEPSEVGHPVAWAGGKALDPLSPEALRDARLKFDRNTSWTYDGFHPRHFCLLTNPALEALGMIVQVSECLGTLPNATREVTVCLIPKKGGHRPIGVYPGLERLVAKARLPLLEKWEAENFRAYLACRKGAAAMDVVWKQSLRAEAAVARKAHAVAVLWDLSSFFDCIDLGVLEQRCLELGMDPVLVQMGIASFRAPRALQVREGRAAPVHPGRGIMAGHTHAKALISAYYIKVVDKWCLDHPEVGVDIFIDDATMHATGDDEEELEDRVVLAAEEFARAIREDLLCDIAIPKAATVASSKRLAEAVRNRA